jgi:Sec-independent protein translocase protein TatA
VLWYGGIKIAFGTVEIVVIVLAIIFLFGGKKFVDWTKKVKEAKTELKGSSKKKK